MDRYKFRGQRLDNGEWVYGSLVERHHSENMPKYSYFLIVERDGTQHFVAHKSVGQFTGLKDANGKDVYEGDKAKITFHDYFSDENFTIEEGESYVERIRQADFVWCIGDIAICNVIDDHDIEVIGTIHDQGES